MTLLLVARFWFVLRAHLYILAGVGHPIVGKVLQDLPALSIKPDKTH